MVQDRVNLDACKHCSLAIALQATARILNQSLNIDEVLGIILENVEHVIPNDAANIMLVHDGYASIAACRGYEKRLGTNKATRTPRKVADVPNMVRMIETHQPVVIPDTEKSSDWVIFETSRWVRSFTSAPICHDGNTIGFLNLSNATPGFYTEAHATNLLAFADQIAVAIRNAQLFSAAQREIAERKRAEADLLNAKAELEERGQQRTLQLRQANEQLRLELERRKGAEAELKKERESLELRIKERTAELRNANVELASASKMKDSFLASTSHELRTPLNAILNVSETLQEQAFGPLNDKQMRLAHTIEESGRHLLALINDILDLSKIGAGKLELVYDIVPVRNLCESSLKFIDEMARKKRLVVSSDIDPKVRYLIGDQRRLKQILVNLLSNAVKFTPQGGSIGLIVKGDLNRQQVNFIVHDNGIGIPEEDIQLLFKPFTQLDHSLSRQFEGTGLGLALVYHLVEMHGGSIQVESKVGSGSIFTISLAWREMLHSNGPEPTQTGPGSPQGQLSNYSNSIAVLAWFLNELAIDVSTVWEGASSMEAVTKLKPGLFLIDADSIDDPLKMIRELKTQETMRPVPVLVVCSNGGEVQNKVSAAGYKTLSMPFTRQLLRDAIRQVTPEGTASLIHRAVIFRRKAPAPHQKNPLVLIADDNETSARIISDYLELNGFTSIFAADGVEAIEQAKTVRPDLILMDIQMPKMDGLAAIRNIRTMPEIQEIPIIAFTALAMVGDRQRCLDAGANEYLSKPMDLRTVVEMINSWVRK